MPEILTEKIHVKFPLPAFPLSASATSRNIALHDTEVQSSRQSFNKGNKIPSSPSAEALSDPVPGPLLHWDTGHLLPYTAHEYPQEPQDRQLEGTSHFPHTPSLTTLSRAHSTASWHREQTNNLRQVIPNKKIACDNTPCSKSLCQEATGEASKLHDMLFSQEESIPSFSKVTQKCWKLQQGHQPEKGENNWRSHSKEVPSSLESWLFATLGYDKTAHKSLIQLHPIFTSGVPCSLRDSTNCSARTKECSKSALSFSHHCFISNLGVNLDQSFVYLHFPSSQEDSSPVGTARHCSGS